jgi:hypothetical protein
MEIDTITDRKRLERIIEARDDAAELTVPEVRDAIERVGEVAEAVFQYSAYPDEGDAEVVCENWKLAVVAGLAETDMVEEGIDSVFESARVDDDRVRGVIRDVFEAVCTEYMDDPPDSEYVVIRKHGGWRQGEGWMTGRLRYLTEEVSLSPAEALDYYFVEVIGLDPAELAAERGGDPDEIAANARRVRRGLG